jgi:small subunit ribosomal protein S20
MANTKSAAKRARQTERRTLMNRRVLSSVKNSLKAVRAAIKAGKKDEARKLVQTFASTVDKAAKTGRLHKNAANRHKSNVTRALAALT